MKYSKLILIILSSCMLGSCEDILDKEDLSAVTEEDNVWGDLDLATAYVNRIYAENLPEWETDWANYSDESDGGGDYLYGQLTENSVNFWPYGNLDTGPNPDVYYGQMRSINILLANIDEGTLEESDKNWLKGQALFFRAWLYFEMVKRYGGVPLVLEPQETTDDLLVERSSTSETIAQIIADLDRAIAYLPTVTAGSGENNGRIHKGTAMAVKGRILLYYASPQFNPNNNPDRWQDAYTANKEAKEFLEAQGFGLYEDFESMFTNEMNEEAIFVRRYEYSPVNPLSFHNWSAATRPLDASQGSTGGNRPTLEMVNAFPMKDGESIGDPASDYEYDPDYYWQNRDPRFYATIVYNGALWELGGQSGRIQWTYVGGEQNNPTLTGFYTRKAIDESQTAIEAFQSGTDWIELRFAEVLMNLAEAANEIGLTEEAYTELKVIRSRAGIDPGPDNMFGLDQGMTQEQMLDAVMLERKIEFAFEGKRYWDLRRRRLFEEVLNGTRRYGYRIELIVSEEEWEAIRNAMTSEELIDHLNENYTDYFEHHLRELDTQFDINWPENYYFFAIPSEHLQLNSNLEQTLGWPGGTFDPLK